MKFLRSILLALSLAVASPAFAQLPAIDAVAGPSTSAQLRRILTDETGTGVAIFGGGDANTLINLNGSAVATGTVAAARLPNAGVTTINGVSCTIGGICTITASAHSITVGVTDVLSGTSNGLLYNNAGDLGNLATAASGVLVTSAGGAPSISTTLPDALAMGTPASLTLTNATGLPNAGLVNSSTTVNGQTCTLGLTCTITATASSLVPGTTTLTGGALNSNGLLFNSANVLTNLASASNGVLVTDGSAVPSISTALPSGLTIPAPTITGALTYGGVTLNNAVTGTGSMVLSDGANINNTMIGQTTSQVGYFQPVFSMLNGYGNQGGGSAWQTQAHADFNVVQTTIPNNPTYWQVYSHASMGIGQTQSGTNQVVRIRGTSFDASWVGKNFFYWNGVNYKVASVTDADNLTVQTTGGGAVVFPSTANNTYYYALTSTDSIVNTSGTAVTYVSGQPFISLGSTIIINGVTYNVSSFNSATSITLGSSAGTQTGVVARQEYNDADVLSCLRTQGLAGADEEALSICTAPSEMRFESVIAGAGSYRPLTFYNGGLKLMSINPNGEVVVTHDGTGNTAFGIQNTDPSGSLWYLVSKTNGDISIFRSGGVGDAINIDKTTFAATFANTVAATGFTAGGNAGLSVTKTVRDSAGLGTCTLVFTGGLLTGGTC